MIQLLLNLLIASVAAAVEKNYGLQSNNLTYGEATHRHIKNDNRRDANRPAGKGRGGKLLLIPGISPPLRFFAEFLS